MPSEEAIDIVQKLIADYERDKRCGKGSWLTVIGAATAIDDLAAGRVEEFDCSQNGP